ncbi:MAG: RluA family pseudouridine synthase [Planctomycetales bacterium]|nr:RluA family pseudouridine synthase [Planctomycetales bacterium]
MTAEALRFETTADDQGLRLDAFLASRLPEASRVRIRRGIDDEAATVDGKVRKASYRIRAGQTIVFALPPPLAAGPEPEPIPLSILFEDESLAVVDKPPGMVVHPAKGHWSGTLASALVHHFEQLSAAGGTARPGIVHRLDRDTSGVIAIAKTDQAHQHLSDQFQARTVRKEYLAIVAGNPDRDRDLIDHAIGDHPTQREKKALRTGHPSSREAQTFYEVEERFPGFALIKAKPKTGRTHQIRLHLASVHCPVVCDKLYGGHSRLTVADCRTRCRAERLAPELPPETLLLERQALHAHRLSIAHPLSGESLEFCAPLPDDMQRLLLILRQINS